MGGLRGGGRESGGDRMFHPPGPVLVSPHRARILIVDDDPRMRELLADMVEGLGHEPVSVPDGITALAAIAS